MVKDVKSNVGMVAVGSEEDGTLGAKTKSLFTGTPGGDCGWGS